jgi:hypothetical protein
VKPSSSRSCGAGGEALVEGDGGLDGGGGDAEMFGEVPVGGDLEVHLEPGGEGFGEDGAVDAGVVSGHHVEPVDGLDAFVAVGRDGDHAAAVHRRVQHREDAGWDQRRVVDEQGSAFAHRDDEGAVDELVAAVG